MCKKQISVSHSSTEAETISLDAGYRMDGIPALDLLDLVIEVFHSSPNQPNKTKDHVRSNSSCNTTLNKHTQNQTKIPTQHDSFDLSNVDDVSLNAKFSRSMLLRETIPTMNTNLDLTNIDHVPSSGTHSGSNVVLYVFEDSEALIMMIIKGRSPVMRHVSRTHRIALD